jgi:hypothetical protein
VFFSTWADRRDIFKELLMKLFNRLPGFTTTPPGKERSVLRSLPKWFWLGSLLLTTPSLVVRLLAGENETQLIMTTDIYVASLVILHWTVIFTVAIAAFIVVAMKGPAYVADAYPLVEAETLDGKVRGTQDGR